MLIYDSSYLLTIIQSKYPGGMSAFSKSGGIVMALPVALKILIYHPSLENDFKRMLSENLKANNIEVLFVEALNFEVLTEVDVEDFRKDLVRYLMIHGLSASRIALSGLMVYVEILKTKSSDPEVINFKKYLSNQSFINNFLVVCKDTVITSEMITGHTIEDLKDKLKGIDTVEDFLKQFGG